METDILQFSVSDEAWTELTHRGKLMDAMLHPGAVFNRPADVLVHPLISEQEKRTILTAWARDALGVESVAPGIAQQLTAGARLDEVLDALEHCDPAAAGDYRGAAAYLRGERSRGERPSGHHRRRWPRVEQVCRLPGSPIPAPSQ